jgi:syntaxin 16
MASRAPKVGFARDKTPLFSRYRAELSRVLPGSSDTPAISRSDPTLVQQATGIEARFLEIETKISELRTLHEERLRSISLFNDTRSLDARIDAITSQSSECINRLREEIKRDVQSTSTGQKRQLQENMQKGHASRLQRITISFRDMQTAYLQKRATAEIRAAAGTDADPDFAVSLDHDMDVAFTGEQRAEVIQHNLMTEERMGDLRQIMEQMARLQEMFADLGTLIIEQGTVLDRIDRNIDAAIEDVEAGNQELAAAEDHQKKGNKCFYIYIVLMVVLVLILGSVILIRKKGKSSGGGGGGGDEPAE